MAYYQDPYQQQGYAAPPAQQDLLGYPPAPQYGYGQPASPNYAPTPTLPPPPAAAVSPDAYETSATALLSGEKSHAIMKIEQVQNLAQRETFLHKNFDIDTLQDIQGLQPMKAGWQFKWETVLGCWTIFNAISTIMIILTNFRRSVDPAKIAAYGASNFDIYMSVITYFPLAFFLTAVLLFNNFYSELSFYEYLMRGAIIDFPASANAGQLFKKVWPLLFMLSSLGYIVAVFVAFIKFGATVGVYLIFINNMLVGVAMSWYRQQSIEAKFVSISNFIQAFPDRNGEYGNMDEQSLHHASLYLQKLTLTECEEPSWGKYMRLHYWRHHNYGTFWRLMHHLLLLAIGAMAGACVAYFVVLRGIDETTTWHNEINPCLNACAEGIANATGTGISQPQCSLCACRCFRNLQFVDKDTFSACKGKGSVPYCNQPSITGNPWCPVIEFCEAQPFW